MLSSAGHHRPERPGHKKAGTAFRSRLYRCPQPNATLFSGRPGLHDHQQFAVAHQHQQIAVDTVRVDAVQFFDKSVFLRLIGTKGPRLLRGRAPADGRARRNRNDRCQVASGLRCERPSTERPESFREQTCPDTEKGAYRSSGKDSGNRPGLAKNLSADVKRNTCQAPPGISRSANRKPLGCTEPGRAIKDNGVRADLRTALRSATPDAAHANRKTRLRRYRAQRGIPLSRYAPSVCGPKSGRTSECSPAMANGMSADGRRP